MPQSKQIRERIKVNMQNREYGCTPKEMAKFLNENESSVRSTMNRMAKEGKLIANFDKVHGLYLSPTLLQKRGHGNHIRFQNIWAVTQLSAPIGQKKYIEYFPNKEKCMWKIKIFTSKNKPQLSISLSGPFGFDAFSVFIGLRYALLKSKEFYGIQTDESKITIHCIEQFTDYIGVSLTKDSITLSAMGANLKKIYDKGTCVRKEERSTIPISWDSLIQIIDNNEPLSKYISGMNTLQRDLNEFKSATIGSLKEIIRQLREKDNNPNNFKNKY